MRNVLIVGAGPTGLTLAVELARRGLDFRIVEKSAAHPAGVRGKGLQPRTLEVFDDLGVVEEVLASGSTYPPIRSWADGEVVWEGRMSEIRQASAAVPYPNLIMQPQWRTERILRERLAQFGHEVELGTELVGFEQDEEGVTATLGGGERERFGYLVGADGGKSFVRGHLGVGFAGETFDSERMLVADVRAKGMDGEHWHVWGDITKKVLNYSLCPIPGTDVFQFTAPGATEFPEIVEEVLWQSEYRVNIRMAERFRVGRVFLAGDAAHVHSPAGGQGLNTGVQDAYNLGWKLAVGDDALLDTYAFERMAVAEHVLGLSTRLLRTGDLKRDEETQQLNLAYLDSPLSRGPRGGERFGALFEEQRGPHFLLLANTSQGYGEAVRVHPPQEGQEGVILVRPDGYVGYHGEESGLSAYLSGFGIAAPAAASS
ncbi:FAD-dependent monooxygenase [Nonomuraea endophytica]|uniref:2-polyprenyl-6-methoxyphenol hydroxylase-like FAD-dependent oxidoreductase n=1 Tax=Nonomuraea endophytica TaxID=714136 RepID=A0A7W8AEE2_9ACTN|nr:FAD-dependent monooxygenase [Nonomuraea endophytica]MBB5083268.1 2-polyprenyl-6-methoxyphenol hydroxylase-like FAD-dependent oxidoreductase [Nonomuraea endophytica]